MNRQFHSGLLVTLLCLSISVLNALGNEDGSVEEKRTLMKNIKVSTTGDKQPTMDFHTVEQEAGKAVLKLLDAKIGKKVTDAAKEVTDFLNDAVDHHAQQRARKIQSDKEKEMSLLHLGTQSIIANTFQNKPKNNKDGSFVVHFKIPYLVTPVDKKKDNPKKIQKINHKPAKTIHPKKYHHRILHRHHHHHRHHPHHRHDHRAHASDAAQHNPPSPPPTNAPPTQASAPIATQSLPTQAPPQPQQTYNAIDFNFNGYNWTYSLRNDTRSDIFPCQGTCMDPCTPDCNLDQDCCCCPDPSMIMPQPSMIMPPQPQVQLQSLVPAPATYPAAIAAPVYQQPQSRAQLQACPLGCRTNCFIYCPRECCGVAGKRDEVAAKNTGSENDEHTGNVEDEGSGSGNDVMEEPARSHPETTQPAVDEEEDDEDASKKAEDKGSSERAEETENTFA